MKANIKKIGESLLVNGDELLNTADITDHAVAHSEANNLIGLFAAAPELLEALKAFDALIKHQYSGTRDAMSDLTYAAQMAQAAIAKAEVAK